MLVQVVSDVKTITKAAAGSGDIELGSNHIKMEVSSLADLNFIKKGVISDLTARTSTLVSPQGQYELWRESAGGNKYEPWVPSVSEACGLLALATDDGFMPGTLGFIGDMKVTKLSTNKWANHSEDIIIKDSDVDAISNVSHSYMFVDNITFIDGASKIEMTHQAAIEVFRNATDPSYKRMYCFGPIPREIVIKLLTGQEYSLVGRDVEFFMYNLR